MKFLQPAILLFTACVVFSYCKKEKVEGTKIPQGFKLSYGDSIIYLKNQQSDHIIYPEYPVRGAYSSFPEGLEMDQETGAINVSESETGLRYRVNFHSTTGAIYTTYIVLAGINYLDRYYNLSKGDTIAKPVYNASWNRTLPASTFDEGNTVTYLGTAIRPTDGQINLAQTVRNGFFGSTPKNDAQKEIEILYRVNDNSNNALQRIKVILYYYRTMSDVPDYLKEVVQARENMIFGLNPSSPVVEETGANVPLSGRLSSLARKPRPPCVVVIAQ